MKLAVILGSTRENRSSERLARWVVNAARELPDTEVELLDLKDFPMPFFDEPFSPRYNQNRQINETAQKWLTKIENADAYVIVTPEYNHSIPGVLKNAFDYVTWEMLRKPVAIVSHGSVGGARAAMHLNEIIIESRAVPIPSHVAFMGVREKLDEAGKLDEEVSKQEHGPHVALEHMLSELTWYRDALTAAGAYA